MKKHSSLPDATAEPRFPPVADQTVGMRIESMGAQGHGVALIGGRKVYIPFTLPGETISAVLVGTKGDAISIDSPSPDRVLPVCRHFGTCGGCSLQHWREAPYAEWKIGLVKAALAREGLAAPIEPFKKLRSGEPPPCNFHGVQGKRRSEAWLQRRPQPRSRRSR